MSVDGIKLNLGCGPVQPEGWVNIDGSMRARLASRLPPVDHLLTRVGLLSPTEFSTKTKTYDLLRSLPFSDASVDAIYAGELWEHLRPDDGKRLMRECYRVLKKQGVLRICVPDGAEFWRAYLEKHQRELEKPVAERDVESVREHVAMYFRDICTQQSYLKSFGHFHKWQYDEVQLVALFLECGFSEATRRRFHDSAIEDVTSVERSDFLIVEGAK